MEVTSEITAKNGLSNNLIKKDSLMNSNVVQVNSFSSELTISEMTDENGNPTEQAYQTAVNKLNEFLEHTQKNSKFVLHKELERYYVEVVDAQTQEVVKEIPPKELLDAYYEMQKLVGKMFDTQA